MVTVENPPPPQKTVYERSFTAYETDRHARAMDKAIDRMSQKYPAAVPYYEALQSLTNQYYQAES